MEIGIIGLPQSGKTTIFNCVTRGRVEVASYSATARKANLGVAKVPDPRLVALEQIFKPRRTIPAEVTYVDIPGAPEGLGKTGGIGGEFLNQLQRTDALLHTVRAFQDPSVPHVEGSVDPYRDIATMELELTFSDLGILERRLERLEAGFKGARAPEREALRREQATLERIKGELEREVPIRDQTISPEEAVLLENYQFLTAKPLLLVLNIDEAQLGQASTMEEELASRLKGNAIRGTSICGKLEMELAQMDEEDEREMRESLAVGESGLERVIRLSYDLLGLVSFFTVVSGEARAWTIARGTPAVKAAGKIHSDMERGFIRAEVVAFDDLAGCGSMAEARKHGLLRLEGKTYPVQDGDVVTFLFNV